MSMRADRWQPRYIDAASVTSSQTITGGNLALDGATGVSIQCVLSNGAAGTLFVDGTNQDGVGANFVTATNVTVAANGSAYITFSLADTLTSLAQARVRFVSTAAGNVTVASNVRRTYP